MAGDEKTSESKKSELSKARDKKEEIKKAFTSSSKHQKRDEHKGSEESSSDESSSGASDKKGSKLRLKNKGNKKTSSSRKQGKDEKHFSGSSSDESSTGSESRQRKSESRPSKKGESVPEPKSSSHTKEQKTIKYEKKKSLSSSDSSSSSEDSDEELNRKSSMKGSKDSRTTVKRKKPKDSSSSDSSSSSSSSEKSSPEKQKKKQSSDSDRMIVKTDKPKTISKPLEKVKDKEMEDTPSTFGSKNKDELAALPPSESKVKGDRWKQQQSVAIDNQKDQSNNSEKDTDSKILEKGDPQERKISLACTVNFSQPSLKAKEKAPTIEGMELDASSDSIMEILREYGGDASNVSLGEDLSIPDLSSTLAENSTPGPENVEALSPSKETLRDRDLDAIKRDTYQDKVKLSNAIFRRTLDKMQKKRKKFRSDSSSSSSSSSSSGSSSSSSSSSSDSSDYKRKNKYSSSSSSSSSDLAEQRAKRRVKTKKTDKKRSQSPIKRRKRSPSPPRSKKVHVGRLSKNVNKEHLFEIFGMYGSVKNIDMPLDRSHSVTRGFAYVEYEHPKEAEKALHHLNGGMVDGQKITVAPVMPFKPQNRPPIRRSPIRRSIYPPNRRYVPAYRPRGERRRRMRSPYRRWSPRRQVSRSPVRSRRPRRRSLSSH